MKKNLVTLIVILALVIAAIKLVPPVNDWARGNLPREILSLIGEKPKNIFERGGDLIGDGLKKGSNLIDDVSKKIKE